MKWIMLLICLTVLGFFAWYFQERAVEFQGGTPTEIGSDRDDESKLVSAIIQRDERTVERLLRDGADPNSVNRFGDSALAWAVNNGDENLVRTLLEQGADPLMTGTYGFQPLHWAAKKGELTLMRLLIDGGAQTNSVDLRGNTPLILAAEKNFSTGVQYLLSQGADPNLFNKRGETALFVAVAAGAAKVVEPLILAGADLSFEAHSGQTALSLAVAKDWNEPFLTPDIVKKIPDIEERLLSHLKIEILNKDQKPEIVIPQLTALIHNLVNEERQAHDLKPLAYDENLARLARGHSEDMGRNNFFNHINPNREGPSERATRLGLSIERKTASGAVQTGIGENILMSDLSKGSQSYVKNGVRYVIRSWFTLEQIAALTVEGWMESPGHRANILYKDYIKEGLGVYVTSDEEIYITQNFQ